MLRVTEGDYDIHFDYNCNKEVMNMGKSFNYMVDQISSLIGKLNLTIEHLKIEKDNVKQEQIMKREAELKAYQTEINPHFLYNALNSIVWLSTEDRSDDISLLAVELANFYENRLHGGDTIITIGSEIEQVRSYMAIQKICYGDSIQTNFNIDESLNDYLIVKLVLQPLVENSIYHGFQVKKTTLEREQSNQITIKVYAENIGINSDILIEIYDNGKGMPLGRIKDINNQLNKQCSISHDSYGIYNVNERIKLYFGEQYGLQYDTQVTEGTKAIIRIPRIEQYIDSSTQRDNVNEIIKIKNSR
jgi:two-component system sensor histidine kinase YesM